MNDTSSTSPFLNVHQVAELLQRERIVGQCIDNHPRIEEIPFGKLAE